MRKTDSIDDAARALFMLGRLFGRTTAPIDRSAIAVVQAIEQAREQGPADVAIGTLARQLGLDPSTASRLVARTIRQRYVRRVASAADGRRVCLELTPRGEALAAEARSYQRSVFRAATRSFTPQQRQAFARLFVAFAANVSAAYLRAHPEAQE
jgi:DNA-binding MarR family transcriptional regulator